MNYYYIIEYNIIYFILNVFHYIFNEIIKNDEVDKKKKIIIILKD